jgi:hypothetical protein
MTEQELDKLRLDTAEKVLELKIDLHHEWQQSVKESYTEAEVKKINDGRGVYLSCDCGLEGYALEMDWTQPCFKPALKCPDYPRSIEAAWQVVGKLPKLGFNGFSLAKEHPGTDFWTCRVSDDSRLFYAVSKEPTLAICLAAYKAVTGEDWTNS